MPLHTPSLARTRDLGALISRSLVTNLLLQTRGKARWFAPRAIYWRHYCSWDGPFIAPVLCSGEFSPTSKVMTLLVVLDPAPPLLQNYVINMHEQPRTDIYKGLSPEPKIRHCVKLTHHLSPMRNYKIYWSDRWFVTHQQFDFSDHT
jgi:hypothetical protein